MHHHMSWDKESKGLEKKGFVSYVVVQTAYALGYITGCKPPFLCGQGDSKYEVTPNTNIQPDIPLFTVLG